MTQNSLAAYAHALFRIIAGFLFSCHGAQIILGVFGGAGPAGGRAAAFSFIWFAGMLELVGGALVCVGLFTRAAAFIISGEMAVAFFMVHFPHGFWPILNGGEPAVFYCFAFLYFAAAGAGPLSLDHLLWGKSSTESASA